MSSYLHHSGDPLHLKAFAGHRSFTEAAALQAPVFRRVKSTLTPILLKSIAIHLPFLLRYICTSMPSPSQKVVYTPPICIAIRLPFVSRYFCRSIRVRGRWNAPKFSIFICLDSSFSADRPRQFMRTLLPARSAIFCQPSVNFLLISVIGGFWEGGSRKEGDSTPQ